MPRRTYITQEEKALPGYKPMKDRFTLLFCANASGNLKIKPLLVYNAENPHAFKSKNVIKSKLPVQWKANIKAWVTWILFTDWLTEVFAPTVKNYLQEMDLPLRCLLLMDNAQAHPPNLEDDLDSEHDFIKVKFLPSNTTLLLQPMDQQVISNFKKLYTKALFTMCFQVTNDTNLTLRAFWKEHFNILHCINLIDKAWSESHRTLQLAWRKLWPTCVPERNFQEFEEESSPDVVHEIVSIGKSLRVEVDDEDVEELLKDHQNELTTEELVAMQEEQMKVLQEEHSSEEEAREEITSAEIKKICKKWNDVQEFIEKHHPNKDVANRVVNLMNDTVLVHFRKILIKRVRQSTLDHFLVPYQKRPRLKETPDAVLSDIFMEGIPLPNIKLRKNKDHFLVPYQKRPRLKETPDGVLSDIFMEGGFLFQTLSSVETKEKAGYAMEIVISIGPGD
ncbi:tigger transposable element-derived protein 1-like [Centruroides sculpturatus]|uniref:tigger transposable element-derived protein 1-like n=1 Tax=Centruroides sculpturatus TaxID=218467 RepID=UPI000C6DBE91|nr:tigger transposable element-derived protein 1-like [Centruroides sculpturatus]